MANSPFKSTKDSRCLRTPAHIAVAVQETGEEDRVGDETGEPKDHGDRLDGQDRERMSNLREVAGRESQEGDDQERGPDSNKDQEVDPIGRRV